ncbi:MAG: hypothetical protein ACR2F8_07710 [Caulobacteraceae bacterium]
MTGALIRRIGGEAAADRHNPPFCARRAGRRRAGKPDDQQTKSLM